MTLTFFYFLFCRTSYDFLLLLFIDPTLSFTFFSSGTITAVDEEVSVVQIISDVRTDVEEQMGMASGTDTDIGHYTKQRGRTSNSRTRTG